MKRILVIEADRDLLKQLKDSFELEGYEVLTATRAEDGLMQIVRHRPDAVILDPMLPKLGGLEVCRVLRERGVETPILALTTRGKDGDKVLTLELGADDYVSKPFDMQEVLARVRAMIRRATRTTGADDVYRFGNVEISFSQQRVRKGNRPISLSALEFEVLRYFIARRGHIIPREHLLSEVWGYQAFRTTRAVDNLVGRLRHKVEDRPAEPAHILTVYGVGYKFVE